MSEMYDLILKNGHVFVENGLKDAEIAVKDGKIAAIGHGFDGEEVFDATGLTILPGVMDTQVHFREPGLTHKEDIEHGTMAAALGGITLIFDMPNVNPLTLTAETHQQKLDIAAEKGWVDYGFFIGGSAENVDQLAELEKRPGCPGVKIFMGSSTGNLLVEDEEILEAIIRDGGVRRITAHAEDEAMLRERAHIAKEGKDPALHPVWRSAETALKATTKLVNLGRKHNRPVHVLHISSKEEMAFLQDQKDIATVEVLANHLTLAAPDCYERLGTHAQQNPPIRDKSHQDVLWQAVNSGLVDVLSTDHAPHTLEEKAKTYPDSPSGTPGVQTFVALMLGHVNSGRLSLAKFVDLTTTGPVRTFGIKNKGKIAVGYDADFTIVDMKADKTFQNDQIVSKCGWTPYDGQKTTAWPMATIIRGQIAMRDDELQARPMVQPVKFQS